MNEWQSGNDLPSNMHKPFSHRRRWLPRYSLRTLFIVMTVTCVVPGYWLNGAVRQQRAVRRFKELSGEVIYYDPRIVPRISEEPQIPRWLRPLGHVIGKDAFGEVLRLHLSGSAVTDDELRYLTDIPTVEDLWLNETQITDEGLVHLRACPKLRVLRLDTALISDQGLAKIGKLDELRTVVIGGATITDSGLAALTKLTKLRRLVFIDTRFKKTAITEAGCRRLKAALPKCEILLRDGEVQ